MCIILILSPNTNIIKEAEIKTFTTLMSISYHDMLKHTPYLCLVGIQCEFSYLLLYLCHKTQFGQNQIHY